MAGFLPRSNTFVGLPEAPLESVSSAGSHVSAAMPLEPLAQARAAGAGDLEPTRLRLGPELLPQT